MSVPMSDSPVASEPLSNINERRILEFVQRNGTASRAVIAPGQRDERTDGLEGGRLSGSERFSGGNGGFGGRVRPSGEVAATIGNGKFS